MAGLLHYNRGANGEPVMPPTQLGDLAGGSFMAVIGILTALVGRAQTGEGRMIDAAMSEGALALLPLATAAYLNTGHAPEPGHSTLDGGLPCYNIYETQDGRHVTLAALEGKFWHAFCTRIDHPELLPLHIPHGPEERAQALEILRGVFKSKARDQWVAELADIDTCIGPVNTIDEAMHDPHAQARGVTVTGGKDGASFQTISSFPRISGVEQVQRHAPPLLGEHTDEVLHAAGYSDPEIAELRDAGAI
jgi:crotonobetainyl-CoA:carnitine CoA-transferase CaiB-like acyl-CoA transferase